jgi:hypothetical protein
MGRIAECSYCQFFARSQHLVCALHPSGPEGETCADYAPTEAEQQMREPIKNLFDRGDLQNRPVNSNEKAYIDIKKLNQLPLELRIRVLRWGVRVRRPWRM